MKYETAKAIEVLMRIARNDGTGGISRRDLEDVAAVQYLSQHGVVRYAGCDHWQLTKRGEEIVESIDAQFIL